MASAVQFADLSAAARVVADAAGAAQTTQTAEDAAQAQLDQAKADNAAKAGELKSALADLAAKQSAASF